MLFLLAGMLALAWFWYDSLRARERANATALETCRSTGASLLVTSPASDADKATPLANLAVVTAQGGSRVVVVDCDLFFNLLIRIGQVLELDFRV